MRRAWSTITRARIFFLRLGMGHCPMLRSCRSHERLKGSLIVPICVPQFCGLQHLCILASASIFAADNLSASTFAADGQGVFEWHGGELGVPSPELGVPSPVVAPTARTGRPRVPICLCADAGVSSNQVYLFGSYGLQGDRVMHIV